MLQPVDLASRFGPSELLGHFVLAREPVAAPETWEHHEHGGWTLRTESSLPVLAAKDLHGTQIGWFLGHPIDGQQLLTGDVAVPLQATASGVVERFEDHIAGLGGRFLGVLVAPGAARVFPDAIGSLSILFSEDEQVLASSPFLIPYGPNTGDDSELLAALRIDSSRGRLLFGLGPRQGVERLLPNHVLDLDTWRAGRAWPRHELSERATDPADAVSEVSERLERTLGALTTRGPVDVSLTAGYDSRMLLACTRPHLSRLRFVTLPIPDSTGQVDVNVARAISRRFDLDHLVPRWAEATESDKELWLYRTGFTAGEPRGQRAVRSQASLGRGRPWASGLCGEFGRKVRLERRGWSSGTPTPEALVGQFWGVPHPRLVEQARRWLERVPVSDPITIVELSWMENSLGSWGGPLTYGCPEGYEFTVYPLGHRRNFELWLGLPPEYRASGAFATDLIGSRWPELLAFPFNAPVGWLGRRAGARRLVRRVRQRVRRG